MAQENALVRADVIEINEFPNMAQMYGVRAVPKTVINNMLDVMGAVAEPAFLEQVLKVGVRKVTQSEETGAAKKE